jgi:oligoribonuclease NrnB/cAMP/cGMP phosphodiesterase (DHH superfamily)
MKCFYHDDLDGKCAAAIVYKWHIDNHIPVEHSDFCQIDYPATISTEDIHDGDLVFIVDFSVSPDEYKLLMEKAADVIWIDHHRSALEKYESANVHPMGVRDTKESACLLTWKYLYETCGVPLAIKFISDMDTWTWEYGTITELFISGLESLPTDPLSCVWEELFDLGGPSYVDTAYWLLDKATAYRKILDRGEVVKDYKKQWYSSYTRKRAFTSYIEGHRCLCLNLGDAGIEAFGDDTSSYPIVVAFAFDGDFCKVSLRATTPISEGGVDVGKMAEKYGGGGHPSAAGFTIPREKFFESFTKEGR